jgi:hypothetical protein
MLGLLMFETSRLFGIEAQLKDEPRMQTVSNITIQKL